MCFRLPFPLYLWTVHPCANSKEKNTWQGLFFAHFIVNSRQLCISFRQLNRREGEKLLPLLVWNLLIYWVQIHRIIFHCTQNMIATLVAKSNRLNTREIKNQEGILFFIAFWGISLALARWACLAQVSFITMWGVSPQRAAGDLHISK